MNKKEKVQIEKILQKAKKDKRIIAVLLFGSCSREEYHNDIDICLVLDKKYSNREMFNIRLEFLKGMNDKFDIQVFQQLPLYIRINILKEGKPLLCKNQDLLYELAFATIKEFGFYKGRYDYYINSVLKNEK